ncbi:MAG: hypothetical protein KBT32_07960 [Bacteroidales bacterium]|nr:hypothetical protein [Candidatus Physcocola equi]
MEIVHHAGARRYSDESIAVEEFAPVRKVTLKTSGIIAEPEVKCSGTLIPGISVIDILVLDPGRGGAAVITVGGCIVEPRDGKIHQTCVPWQLGHPVRRIHIRGIGIVGVRRNYK